MLTAALLVAGLLLGAIILILGVAYDSWIVFAGGAATLLFTPILCAARFNMLRLYRIIQALASEERTRTGSIE